MNVQGTSPSVIPSNVTTTSSTVFPATSTSPLSTYNPTSAPIDKWGIAPWSKLPRPSASMAVGHDSSSNILYLIGGNHPKQLISFDINRWNEINAFKDYGINALSNDFFFFYTQIGDYLYLSSGTEIISTFQLSSQQFVYNFSTIPTTAVRTCLAHIDNYLIISGGRNGSSSGPRVDLVSIFNISDHSWLPTHNIPKMLQPREEQSCIVSTTNRYLYEIGGTKFSGSGLDTVEILYVGDIHWIHHHVFREINDKLYTTTVYPKSVIYNNQIYVIGGYNPSDDKHIDIIDTATNTITSFDELTVNLHGVTPIVVDSRVYVFGGYNGSGAQDIWQYFDFPTYAPSNVPSYSPTLPTTMPTNTPTFSPTLNPTFTPSSSPTSSPTVYPTPAPTISPLAFADLIANDNVSDVSDNYDPFIYSILIGVPVLLMIVGGIMSFKPTLFKTEIKDQRYKSICLYFVQLIDIYSDGMFTIQLYQYYLFTQFSKYEILNETTNILYILFFLSMFFTIMPYLANIISCFRIVSSIITDDNTISEFSKKYFKNNSNLYIIGVLLSGGSFYTLQALNSNFLGLPHLSAGLSQIQIEKFVSHKIWLTSILENLPQLIIQSYFIGKLNLITTVVIISLISSGFNILLSVLIYVIKRIQLRDQTEMPFKINLSKDIYKNGDRREELRKTLKSLFDKNNANDFEILSFNKDTNTLYGVVIYQSHNDDNINEIIELLTNSNIQECINEAFGDGLIANIEPLSKPNGNTKKSNIEIQMRQVVGCNDEKKEEEKDEVHQSRHDGDNQLLSQLVVANNDNPDNELFNFLKSVKLEAFYDSFIKHEFDVDDIDILKEVKESHLRELGMDKIGQRLKFIKGIKRIRDANYSGNEDEMNDHKVQNPMKSFGTFCVVL